MHFNARPRAVGRLLPALPWAARNRRALAMISPADQGPGLPKVPVRQAARFTADCAFVRPRQTSIFGGAAAYRALWLKAGGNKSEFNWCVTLLIVLFCGSVRSCLTPYEFRGSTVTAG
jgi:hypothetical protein